MLPGRRAAAGRAFGQTEFCLIHFLIDESRDEFALSLSRVQTFATDTWLGSTVQAEFATEVWETPGSANCRRIIALSEQVNENKFL